MPFNHSSQYSELTDAQFILIGKIVIEFSNIDFLAGQLLTRLLLTPDFLGRTYTDFLSVSNIQQAISSALEMHSYRYGYRIINEATCDEIKSANTRIDAIRAYRNKFAHYCWARDNDNQIFGTSFSGKVPNERKPDRDSITLTNDQLKNIYDTAYAIVDEINRLVRLLPEVEEGRKLLEAFKIQDQQQ